MSHFAVLVIGEDITDQLNKFDCNMEVEQYMAYTKEELIAKGKKDIQNYKDTTYAEYLKDPVGYIDSCKNEKHLKYVMQEFPEKLKWTDQQIYEDEIRHYDKKDIGENGEVYSTYNPNAKWDWWTIGGRYSNFIPLKRKGCFVDSATIEEIDFEKIHLSKDKYDQEIRFWEMKVEGDQPITKKELELTESFEFLFYEKEFYIKRYKNKETYAKCNSSFSTWGVVKDGEWFEKGEMGWFSFSNETDEQALDWELNFYDRFIKDLSPDTKITIVDCHI